MVLEVESIDRMYLNVYQPLPQYGGGGEVFFVGAPEKQVPLDLARCSPAESGASSISTRVHQD